jgi:hypothetical protein
MIDPSKTYRTRDGREVRIYAVDGYGHYPVHGAYNLGDNDWQACCWTETGCANHREFIPAIDLIEVRPRIKREVWVNVYSDFDVAYRSRGEADGNALQRRIACVKLVIDCEEGEGL